MGVVDIMTKVTPASTYTTEDFIQCAASDEITYRNFSILEKREGIDIEFIDHNIIYDYLDELKAICTERFTITKQDINRYIYAPDLLAFDIYGSTQLDFVIMAANDMVDPKEFTMRTLRLPTRSALIRFMSQIYNAEKKYITNNRSEIGEAVI